MIPVITLQSLYAISPLLFLLGLGSLALVLEVLWREPGRSLNGILCLIGLVAASILTVNFLVDADVRMLSPFGGSLLFDSYALICTLIVLLATGLSLALQIQDKEIRCGEGYALTIFSCCGMILMVSAVEFFSLILGLEVMSLSIYALAGMKRTDLFSNEAALKYFVMGAFSSCVFLYGIAFCYGSTGSVTFSEIAAAFPGTKGSFLLLGMFLILAGFSFKVALVPFHMWAPDVYEGAPTAITSLMATGVKAAGFAAFLRVLLHAFPEFYFEWSSVLGVFAVLTMSLGNVIALAQKSVKRMLSYSSIAHAGYLTLGLIACCSGNEAFSISSLLFYLLSYTFMTAGAFAMVWWMETRSEAQDALRFRGLAWKNPWLCAALSLFLLSLAGIPPTAGFFAKFFVFSAVLKAGNLWLVLIAVLNSVVALYYYLRPLVWMFMEEESESILSFPRLVPILVSFVLIVSVLGTLALGLFPKLSGDWALTAANSLLVLKPLAANGM